VLHIYIYIYIYDISHLRVNIIQTNIMFQKETYNIRRVVSSDACSSIVLEVASRSITAFWQPLISHSINHSTPPPSTSLLQLLRQIHPLARHARAVSAHQAAVIARLLSAVEAEFPLRLVEDLKISRTATATSAARHKVALLGHQPSLVHSRPLASCQSAGCNDPYDGIAHRVIT